MLEFLLLGGATLILSISGSVRHVLKEHLIDNNLNDEQIETLKRLMSSPEYRPKFFQRLNLNYVQAMVDYVANGTEIPRHLLKAPPLRLEYSAPEKIIPTYMVQAQDFLRLLRFIHGEMRKNNHPLHDHFTSVTVRFDLMLNAQYEEDLFELTLKQHRKFFSVFVATTLESFDVQEYHRSRDKSQYLQIFDTIYRATFPVVDFYESKKGEHQNLLLAKIADAAEYIGVEDHVVALPAPQSVLSLGYGGDDKYFTVEIYDDKDVVIHPNMLLMLEHYDAYLAAVSEYLDTLLHDKKEVILIHDFGFGEKKRHSWRLENAHLENNKWVVSRKSMFHVLRLIESPGEEFKLFFMDCDIVVDGAIVHIRRTQNQ